MKSESNGETSETESESIATETQEQPRKALLGKRVLRHFNVKTSIQTGVVNYSSNSDGTYSGRSRSTAG